MEFKLLFDVDSYVRWKNLHIDLQTYMGTGLCFGGVGLGLEESAVDTCAMGLEMCLLLDTTGPSKLSHSVNSEH